MFNKIMKFRQSVISVFKPIDGTGNFLKIPSLEIVFRQPFHNFGLAYSFSFSKSYWAPFTTCELSIENVDNTIVDAFYFDTEPLTKRPLVEIRAGYSSVKMKKIQELNLLKQNLPLIYSGTPYYVQDNKIAGGRTLNISLSDFQSFTRVGRVVKKYFKGQSIISIIDSLITSIGAMGSTLELETPEFQALKLENDLMYNHRHVLSDILPELARQYSFYFFIGPHGIYEFRPALNTTPGIFKNVNSTNGLIEHPVGINFVQWTIKTFFGLPSFMYPGDRVKIESEHFKRIARLQTNLNIDNTLQGLIVTGNYNWNDTDADITYTIAADGQPINVNKIIPI